jgi:hypothetical protein
MNNFSKIVFSVDMFMNLLALLIVTLALFWFCCADAGEPTRRAGDWWAHFEGPHVTTHNAPNERHKTNASHDKACDRQFNPGCSSTERQKRDRELDHSNKNGHKRYAKAEKSVQQ